MSPADLETAVRRVDASLAGQLSLGVAMWGRGATTKLRMEAQKFETMFSQHPCRNTPWVTSRYPLSPPCPDVIGVPVTGDAQEAERAAERGYDPLTPSWLSASAAARHWPAIVKGATSALRRACPSGWQLARSIVIHDDPVMVDAYVFGAKSPFRAYYTRLAKAGLIEPNMDDFLKQVVIFGSVHQVADKIMELRETVGQFGMLHLVDVAQSDPEMTRKTMINLAEGVVPIVGDPDAAIHKILENT